MDNVVFIHRGGPTFATYRLRAETPAKLLGATVNEGEAYIAVFVKPVPEDTQIAREVKKNGGKVVLDISDPHNYREIAKFADLITTPTEVCRDIIRAEYERDAFIVNDPYELPEVTAHACGTKKVWYGHTVNLKDIAKWQNLDGLTIVAGPNPPTGCTFWSPENQDRAMREANWALFPTRQGSEYKSPNRLLNAIRMGLFPICDPHPAYDEFKDLVWTGGLPTGLRWAEHFQRNLNSLVREGQRYIEKYSPERIAEQWKEALDSI